MSAIYTKRCFNASTESDHVRILSRFLVSDLATVQTTVTVATRLEGVRVYVTDHNIIITVLRC